MDFNKNDKPLSFEEKMAEVNAKFGSVLEVLGNKTRKKDQLLVLHSLLDKKRLSWSCLLQFETILNKIINCVTKNSTDGSAFTEQTGTVKQVEDSIPYKNGNGNPSLRINKPQISPFEENTTNKVMEMEQPRRNVLPNTRSVNQPGCIKFSKSYVNPDNSCSQHQKTFLENSSSIVTIDLTDDYLSKGYDWKKLPNKSVKRRQSNFGNGFKEIKRVELRNSTSQLSYNETHPEVVVVASVSRSKPSQNPAVGTQFTELNKSKLYQKVKTDKMMLNSRIVNMKYGTVLDLDDKKVHNKLKRHRNKTHSPAETSPTKKTCTTTEPTGNQFPNFTIKNDPIINNANIFNTKLDNKTCKNLLSAVEFLGLNEQTKVLNNTISYNTFSDSNGNPNINHSEQSSLKSSKTKKQTMAPPTEPQQPNSTCLPKRPLPYNYTLQQPAQHNNLNLNNCTSLYHLPSCLGVPNEPSRHSDNNQTYSNFTHLSFSSNTNMSFPYFNDSSTPHAPNKTSQECSNNSEGFSSVVSFAKDNLLNRLDGIPCKIDKVFSTAEKNNAAELGNLNKVCFGIERRVLPSFENGMTDGELFPPPRSFHGENQAVIGNCGDDISYENMLPYDGLVQNADNETIKVDRETLSGLSNVYPQKSWKRPLAYSAMLTLEKLSHFYKCMDQDCSFSHYEEEAFKKHLQLHIMLDKFFEAVKNKWNLCSYCCEKLPDVPSYMLHLSSTHACCHIQCRYCFHRSTSVLEVLDHQIEYHTEETPHVLKCIGPQLSQSICLNYENKELSNVI